MAAAADAALAHLARATGSTAIAALDGATLLGERAALHGYSIPGDVCAGGACRLLAAKDDAIALNLARPDDREMLPALFEDAALDAGDDTAIAARVAGCDAALLVARGRTMGLAIAQLREAWPIPVVMSAEMTPGCVAPWAARSRPRVVDLSALWAGPLATHLLWLAGAEVIRIESPSRPDGMRTAQPDFHALLAQGKAPLSLDLRDAQDRAMLLDLVAGADIVVESTRPRALEQLGISAHRMVQAFPGLVWLSLTGHGGSDEAAGWVGFGDDCSVAGGLSAALQDAGGGLGFVGDAIADPLTGIHAALLGWTRWQTRRGGRQALALRDVAALCLEQERRRNPSALRQSLLAWGQGRGQTFPQVRRRRIRATALRPSNTWQTSD